VQRRAVAVLDSSIEADKESNPFLNGVPAVLESLRSRQIECRVYDREKFHAKAYITHAKLEVVGSQALVGSSNFSAPGLTKNIELNVQIQSAREVGQLQEWFEAHWNEATEGDGGDHRGHFPSRAPLHAIRCLRQGASGVLPRARADGD
jgi:phosphatidylserine/phosphatidylglycerophosphate/cardiolipin synthase-like enzyme